MSRFASRILCRIEITDDQMHSIHEGLCTTLIIKNGKRPLQVGDKLELTSPIGLRDDVIVRHVERNSPAVQAGYSIISIVVEEMVPFNAWNIIRTLREELNSAPHSIGGAAA